MCESSATLREDSHTHILSNSYPSVKRQPTGHTHTWQRLKKRGGMLIRGLAYYQCWKQFCWLICFWNLWNFFQDSLMN